MNLLRRHWPAAIILTLFFVLGGIYNVIVPIFEAPDELYHYPFVAHLAQGGDLPVQRADQRMFWQQEGSQPPLYYALAGRLTSWLAVDDLPAIYRLNPHARIGIPLAHDNKNIAVHTDRELFPWRGAILGIHLIRIFSLLLATGTLLCTYRIAFVIFPDRPIIAITALALNAFIPMFIFISASVNNDNLVIFLSSLTLLMLVRVIQRGATRRFLLLLGIVIGLACLTKLSALGLAPLAGLAILYRRFLSPAESPATPQGQRAISHADFTTRLWQMALDGAVLLAPILLIAGWWYVRNWQLYGDPTGLNAMLDIVGRRPVPPSLLDLWDEFEGLRINFWGLFGVVNVLQRPVWVYRLFDGLTVVSLIGLVAWLRQNRRAQRMIPWPELALLGTWATLEFLLLIRWTTATFASQGRLLFPAISAMCLFLALGLLGWMPERWQRWGAGVLAVFFLTLSMAAPFTAIKPAYARPPILTEADIPSSAQPYNVTYDNVARLLAFEVDKNSVCPGETLPVTLYWQALSPTTEDISLFVQLVGGQDQILGQVDSYPGGGAYPTSMWSPGQVIRDEYRVPISVTPTEPIAAFLQAGLYRYRTGKRLPATDPNGQPVSRPVLTRIKIAVATSPNRPTQALDANFDNAVRLIGYDLPVGTARAGAEAPLTLHWQVSRALGRDYAVFVHLLDADEALIGQGDGPPLGNAYPTSFWSPGDNLADTYRLRIFDTAKPGQHRIAIGFYDPISGQRLPVMDASGQIIGDRVWVAPLVVTDRP